MCNRRTIPVRRSGDVSLEDMGLEMADDAPTDDDDTDEEPLRDFFFLPTLAGAYYSWLWPHSYIFPRSRRAPPYERRRPLMCLQIVSC